HQHHTSNPPSSPLFFFPKFSSTRASIEEHPRNRILEFFLFRVKFWSQIRMTSRPSKRSPDAGESSGSQPPHNPAPTFDLSFKWKDKEAKDIWAKIKNKEVVGMGVLQWDELETKGWKDRLVNYLDQAGLLPLFQESEVAPELSTKEVITSFKFDPAPDPRRKKAIHFQLGGEQHHCTIDEFGIALGLYTA
ncbi:hypothetical protein LINGRAHAP2_LOCUS4480, partial [Linum grandiflorum]